VLHFPQKKTLNFPQNLENKELDFFSSCRSMVLKVVTGKILETLELRYSPAAYGSVPEQQAGKKAFAFAAQDCRTQPLVLAARCAHVELSKNADYLIDNLGIVILS
jgi:hypothetical protein